jgi:hypothetical protein
VYSSEDIVDGKYSVNVKAKVRYIVPLVDTENGAVRINEISKKAADKINEYLNSSKGGYYTYYDFPFVPYKEPSKRKSYLKK